MTSNASYDRSTSGAEVARVYHDQVKGRNILITGVGPLGIGETSLLALAAQQPNLITVTGRSPEKINESIAKAKAEYPDVNVRSLILDLSSIASVRKAAAEFLATPEPLDILINNAGVMAPPTRLVSADNIEIQFATNHIGHFLFTNLIMPKLLAAAAANPTKGATRIINVSSFGHSANPIRFSDWNWEGGDVPDSEKGSVEQLTLFNEKDHTFTKYTPYGAYGQSKTANVLYSVELTRRLFEKHGILSLSLHPGGIMTQLGRHASQSDKEFWEAAFKDYVFWKNGDQGCSTTLVAALDPALNKWTPETGYYLDDCQFKAPVPWAVDPEAAQRLWKLSEEIVNEKFDF
ncbi:hypothetical protein TWF696_001098 [Orbilia brochopaga]|uniref:NAD(P)-binding protein n=1 Tax=Orbilia brochopaga TaxID=3140254 RepID=A0AAV9VGW5_9PEZI